MTAADWTTLIVIGIPAITSAVVSIITSIRQTQTHAAIETVHQAVNGQAELLAKTNADTISELRHQLSDVLRHTPLADWPTQFPQPPEVPPSA